MDYFVIFSFFLPGKIIAFQPFSSFCDILPLIFMAECSILYRV